jgi:hypothetical protein
LVVPSIAFVRNFVFPVSLVIGDLQRIGSRWLDSPVVVVESDVDVSTEPPWPFTVMVRQLGVAGALTP